MPESNGEKIMADYVAGSISPDEEKKLLLYYQTKLIGMCRFLNTQIQVYNTAITYFKLFFKRKKVYNYNMANLVAAVVFLSMKVENIYITVETLKEKLSFVEADRIVKYELEICKEIGFNFHISSPHLRLLGLYLLLQSKKQRGAEYDSPIQTQEIAEDPSLSADGAAEEEPRDYSWALAVENLNKIMLAERYLDFNINDVAIAALNVRSSDLVGLFMEHTIEQVRCIRQETAGVVVPSKEELRHIDGKIKEIQQKYNIRV